MNRLDLSGLPNLGNREGQNPKSELVSDRGGVGSGIGKREKANTTNVAGISQLLANSKYDLTGVKDKKLRLKK